MPRFLRVALIVLAVAVLAVVLVLWGPAIWGFLSDRTRIEAMLRSLGPWGPIGLIGLQTLQIFLLPIPGFFGMLGGFFYGFGLGLLYTQIGTVLGSMIAFQLARWFGRPLVVRLVKPDQLARVDRLLRNKGPLFFLLYFWAPYVPKDAMCYVAGLTPIRALSFLLVCFFGRLLGSIGATLVGAGIWQINLPVWGWVLVAVLVACLAALLVRYRQSLRSWMQRVLLGEGEALPTIVSTNTAEVAGEVASVGSSSETIGDDRELAG